MNGHEVATPYKTLNNILSTVLKTSPFVAGVIAAFLDNTVAGTPKERGLREFQRERATSQNYDVPCLAWMSQRVPFLKHLPICSSSQVSTYLFYVQVV